jgi:tetratricopeptide (TPR) repeat protein
MIHYVNPPTRPTLIYQGVGVSLTLTQRVVDKKNDTVVLPLRAIEEVNKAKEEASLQAQLAKEARSEAEAAYLKIELLQLQGAEEAASLAEEGLLELARQRFVGVISDTSNIRILYLAYEFFYRTGDLKSALNVLQRWLILSGPDKQSPNTAAAYGNLGNLYKTRGDIDRAEEMYQKSLLLFRELESPLAEEVADLINGLRSV